jgi:hypothetical protein
MRSLRKSRIQSLQWVQPRSLNRYHELVADGELYGTLTWQKMFGSLALAVCAEGTYSFKKGGFLHPFVAIRRLSVEDDFGKMDMKLGQNGLLVLTDGQTFEFRRLGLWKSQWSFFDESGELLCTFTRKTKVLRQTGVISIEDKAVRKIHLPLLLLVGWYVIVLFTREEVVATGAGAGGS